MTNSDFCHFLEWDSKFFGYRIARVSQHHLNEEQAEEVDNWAQLNDIDCLYYLTEYEDENVDVAQNFNYRLRSMPLTLSLKLPENLIPVPELGDLVTDIANEDDLPDLMDMIDNSFIYTRFSTDKHFSKQQTDELYQTWVKLSILEGYTDRTIVIRKNNRTVGFLSSDLILEEKVGAPSLMGIAASERKKNLSSALISASINYYIEENMVSSYFDTQARNIGAQRAFQKYGYRTSNVRLWYHKWYT